MNGITLGRAGMFGYQAQYTQGKTSKMSLRDRYYFGKLDPHPERPVPTYRNALYSTGGMSTGQSMHLVYDESSTEENPVMKAWGVDSKGEDYEELIYINQINPRYATTPEMKALEIHLQKTGDSVLTAQMPRHQNLIGGAVNAFDVHEKIDFIQLFHEIADKTMEPGRDVTARLDADRFLYWWMTKENKLMEDMSGTQEVTSI